MTKPSSLTGLRVLVVDDDATTRTLVCRTLQRMKVIATFEADSGEQALEALASDGREVDLVISDWTMPGMTGLDLFRQLRADKPELMFLMLTGRADHESLAIARQAGVPAFAIKPISAQELRAKIDALLGASKAP
jgi:CheY-like chemotaxis protein